MEREDWSWEQFVDRLIPNLQSFSKTVKELADPKNMHRGTREVLNVYLDGRWHDDGQVAELVGGKDDAAGARRRELHDTYGYQFEKKVIGSYWQYRLVRDEKIPCV